jgi:hypothetical protein
MCGLSTIVNFDPSAGLLTSLLAMHQQIPFRGPDGEGFSVVDSCRRSISAGSESDIRDQVTKLKWSRIERDRFMAD